MTDRDDDERAELLGRLLSGDADRTDPAVARALERDPSLLQELTDLQSLADDLDGERVSERVPQLPAEEPWPDADRRIREVVHTHLRARAAPVGPVAPARRSRRWWLLAAVVAAAAVIAFAVLRPGTDDLQVAPPDRVLGLNAGEVWPLGEVARAELRARDFAANFGEALPTDRYTIRIADEPPMPLREPQWRAPQELIARLPARFQWTIERQRAGLPPEPLHGDVTLH